MKQRRYRAREHESSPHASYERKKGRPWAPLSCTSKPLSQVQVITPAEDIAQVLVVSACVAAADQPLGLVVAVAVTVTFCEGVNPTAEPSPEK